MKSSIVLPYSRRCSGHFFQKKANSVRHLETSFRGSTGMPEKMKTRIRGDFQSNLVRRAGFLKRAFAGPPARAANRHYFPARADFVGRFSRGCGPGVPGRFCGPFSKALWAGCCPLLPWGP